MPTSTPNKYAIVYSRLLFKNIANINVDSDTGISNSMSS